MALALIVLIAAVALVWATTPRREPELPGWTWRKLNKLPVVRR